MSKLLTTSWYYSGFGTKLSPFFGFAKSFKYKTNFPLSQLPKSVVVAVGGCYFFDSISCFNFVNDCFIFSDLVLFSKRFTFSSKLS